MRSNGAARGSDAAEQTSFSRMVMRIRAYAIKEKGGRAEPFSYEIAYGNYIGSRRETTQMLEFSAEHGITSVVDVMPFSRISEAITRVRRRDVLMGLVLEERQ